MLTDGTPGVGVNVHTDDHTQLVINASATGSFWLEVRGAGYSAASIFASHATMLRLRDELVAYFGAAEAQAEAA